MNGSRLLVTVSIVGLMFACLTGDIHRPGIWQGGILSILSGLGMVAAQGAVMPASVGRKLGMIYLAAGIGLLGALLLARQMEPAAANWVFAATAVVFAAPLLLVFGARRSAG